ncbi:MAG: methyl-accepting chemotaxis protein [Vicinamibacterales bacterium]
MTPDTSDAHGPSDTPVLPAGPAVARAEVAADGGADGNTAPPRRTTRPVPAVTLDQVAEVCERAAAGDLEARIVGMPEDAAMTRVCRAINQVLDTSDSFVREASAAMDACAHDRFSRPILQRGLLGAYRTSAGVINRAGLKMQQSAEQLACTGQLAGETSTNVSMIAAACEELSSTSTAISAQTGESARLANEAVGQAAEATGAVSALHDAARRIERIISLITTIAHQTNLLALNATIEAARAGEHGRGFAVVANEVKELSRSSAQATQEIDQHVAMMQATVGQVAGFIDGISRTIARLDDGAGTIARAVEEQVIATANISRNIAQASGSITRISERIAGAPADAARRSSEAA